MAYVGSDRVPGVCYIMHAERIKKYRACKPILVFPCPAQCVGRYQATN